MKRIIGFAFFTSVSANAYAPSESLGDLSDKLMLPMSVLTSALYNMSLAIGIALLFGALIQYKNYRNNPSQVPMSRFVTLLIFGLALIALPIIAKFSASAELLSGV